MVAVLMALSFNHKEAFIIPGKPTKEQWRRIVLFINNLMLYNTLVICHKEFMVKSKGEIDSYGEQWKPLAESTKIYKSLRPGEYRKYKMNLWNGNRTATKGKTKRELLADRDVPINIDTGRLVKALKPNRFSNGVYIPRADQQVRVTASSIHFKLLVPYADDVNAVRPIFPIFEQPWIDDAIALSKMQVAQFLSTMKL
jgi:hypothetical protein